MPTVLHTLATFNMSFSGDKGLDPRRADVFESEGAFHLSNTTGQPRQFWINAAGLVSDFWTNHPHASVMGLQEMNKTTCQDHGGSAMIEANVRRIAEQKGFINVVNIQI